MKILEAEFTVLSVQALSISICSHAVMYTRQSLQNLRLLIDNIKHSL